MGHSSIAYAMLALDSQQYKNIKSENEMDIDQNETEALNMLRALNRLRN